MTNDLRLLMLSASLKAIPEFLPPPAHIAFFATGGDTEDNPWWVTSERHKLVDMGHTVPISISTSQGQETKRS